MLLEFANLARLWWALLAIPIIILFILRVRLRRKPVATLLFWDQLFQEHPPRAWWRRLRNLIALALQLAFLALLVGALIDPLWGWQKQGARRIVFVIDNSASMSARDAGASATRLDNARAVARRMIASLRQQDTAAIVTAGGLPQVAIAVTGDVRILGEAVDNIAASDNPTQLVAAVGLARRLIADGEGREIIVLTDGADAAIGDLEQAPDVTVYGFGQKTGNVAITSFQVRRSVADATSFQVLVEAANFGDQPVECRLDLELEGLVVDVIPLTLQPGQPWRQTLDHTSGEGGRLIARLDIDDALSADNQAVAVLPHREPIPVLLVTPGSHFLRSVFESIPNVALTIADELSADISPETIVVVHKTELKAVPAGPVIVVDPQGDSDLWTVGGETQQPIVAKQAAGSPLMAHIRLQNVLLSGAKDLEFIGEAVPLLQSPTDTALYARIVRTGGDVLVLSAGLADGDLPLRIAFPVMIKNAIESFLGDKGELRPALATGQVAAVALGGSRPTSTEIGANEKEADAGSEPASAAPAPKRAKSIEQLVLRSPRGNVEPVSSVSDAANVGPLDYAGLWLLGPGSVLSGDAADQAEFDIKSGEVTPIAVNLANPNESDLRPRAELPAAPLASVVWGGHSLWFYLALFAVVGICAEWILYQRRIIA